MVLLMIVTGLLIGIVYAVLTLLPVIVPPGKMWDNVKEFPMKRKRN